MTAGLAGPALVLGALIAGIAAGERAGATPGPAVLVLAVAVFAVSVMRALARRPRSGLALCCLAALLAGTALMGRALDGQRRSPLAGPVLQREAARVDVTLAADPRSTRFSSRVLARVERVRIDGGDHPSGGRTVVIDASGGAAPRLAVLSAGDRVRLRGYFRPLDPFESRERWRHAVGAFVADDLVAFGASRTPLLRLASWLRARVVSGHQGAPEPQRALLAGFLLGDTDDLPDAVVSDFRNAGLSHLLAVSGQNVAFVLALVGPVLRRGPRAARLLVGLTVLVVFATMTRFEPSVLRASAMAACSMTALALGRPTAGLRVLTLAVIALLLVDPFLLHSVGFLLSCAASAGIAVLGPPIAARVPGPRPFAEAVGVTVAAQVAVSPLLLAVFDGVPLVAVPANLAAAPFAGPLTVLGLVGGVAGGLAGGGGVVGAVFTFPAYVCASVVLLIARTAAAMPLLLTVRRLLALLPVTALGIGVFAVSRKRRATWPRARPRPPEPRVALPPR